MSKKFDPKATAATVFHRQDTAHGNSLVNRLIAGEWHDELFAIIDKLQSMPTGRGVPRPSHPIDRISIYAYGVGGASNLTVDGARGVARVYEFPQGGTVTVLRKAPYTVRVEDGDGLQLVIARKRLKKQDSWHWEVISHSGFRARSGKRAGSRMAGRGPDKSIG